MSENKIAAVSRTEFGKGAARRTRRAGLVPAVLYGHGTDPVHLSLPGHQLLLALRVANAVLEISVDGAETQLALAKQVQRDPIRGDLEHVDLVIVRKGEKVNVEIALLLIGEHAADRMVVLDSQTVTLEVEATNIPTDIEIDISKLEIGDTVTAADLNLPEGAAFLGDPDQVLVAVTPLQAEEPEAAAETAEGAAEAEEA